MPGTVSPLTMGNATGLAFSGTLLGSYSAYRAMLAGRLLFVVVPPASPPTPLLLPLGMVSLHPYPYIESSS